MILKKNAAVQVANAFSGIFMIFENFWIELTWAWIISKDDWACNTSKSDRLA